MAQESNAKIFGLVGLLVAGLGLWWWMDRSGAEPAASEGEGTNAAATADPRGPGLVPAPARRSDVDPWKAPRAVVTGTVRDVQGRPIPGAQVCAKLKDDSLVETRRHPPHCVTTRDDGTYRVDDLLGAEHQLFASAEGFIPSRYRSRRGIQDSLSSQIDLKAGTTRSEVDFVLKEGGVKVEGVVKDIAGGEIEGAWVSSGNSWRGSQGAAFTRSNEEGRFSLWVEPPSVSIKAYADGYSSGSRRAAIPGSFVEVFLTPESVVVGKVVWADSGKAVEGAHVSASESWWRGGGSTHSGEDGTFRLDGLEPGAYKINVYDEELIGISAEKVHVGLGQTSDPVVVKVHAAFSVRGVVMADAQTPCSYGSVQLQDKDRKNERPSGSRGQEDGSVLVKGLLPGTYEITVQCQGYVAEPEYPDIVIADASIEGQSWSMHAGQAIRGIVIDAKGEPVEGARVSARAKASKDPRAQRSNNWGDAARSTGASNSPACSPAATSSRSIMTISRPPTSPWRWSFPRARTSRTSPSSCPPAERSRAWYATRKARGSPASRCLFVGPAGAGTPGPMTRGASFLRT